MLKLQIYEMNGAQLDSILDTSEPTTSNCIQLKVKDTSEYPWVVIEFQGEDRQKEIDSFPTFQDALNYVKRNKFGDVMKRLPNGGLTSEF